MRCRLTGLRLCVPILCVGAFVTVHGENKDLLPPATPEPLIERWAERVGPPAWRIPIGAAYVDGMDRVDENLLYVGLRDIGQRVGNQPSLLVDISTGQVVWRAQREKGGVYSYLFSNAGLIFEQHDDAPQHRLRALDKGTGALRWQVQRTGESVRFAPAPRHDVLLVETRDGRTIEVEAVRLSNGERSWRRAHHLEDDAGLPAPAAVVGEAVYIFHEGVTAVRPSDGVPLWRRADVHVSENDPPPREVDEALVVARGERLEALALETGETVWAATLGMRASDVYPYRDTVLVRGVAPYRDPRGRFALQVPPSWSLNWQEKDVTYRFDDLAGGAFLLISWVTPKEGARLDLPAVYGVMRGTVDSITDGKAGQLDDEELRIGDLPARRTRFEHAAKAGATRMAAVTEIVAVYSEQLQAGCGLLAFSPAPRYGAVKEHIDRAVHSLRFLRASSGQGSTSLVDRWRRRSANADAGTATPATAPDGSTVDQSKLRYRIAAVRAADGHELWHHDTTAPTVSNFIVQADRLYVATSGELIALDAASGARAFAVTASDIGRTFPVRLRAYEERIVYVGELVVAAYDPVSGAELYRHGFTPLSQETTLDGLDNSIPVFDAMARAVRQVQPETGNVAGLMAEHRAAEAVRYQQLSDKLDGRIRYLKSTGRDYELESHQRDMARRTANVQANAALAQSLVSVGGMLAEEFRLRGWERHYQNLLTHQQLFRRSIVAAYAGAEIMDWVYRPHRRMSLSGDGDFATVSVVHLPTGRRRTITLSPSYLNYGLWNHVDLERGLVVHHGIGLDTSRYEYAPRERVGSLGDVRTVGSFLLAVPAEIPGLEPPDVPAPGQPR